MSALIKTSEEIVAMRRAGRAAAQLLSWLIPQIRTGMTTEDIDILARDYTNDVLHAQSAPLNYHGFPKHICTSVNAVVCHGIPDATVLKDGDIVNIDVTPKVDGFHGDTSAMVCIGTVSESARRLVDVAYDALWRGICSVRPGARLGDIGYAIQSYVEAQGFSVVRDYCGHGIGRGFHEEPQVLHYGTRGTGMVLEPGMIFTIEPMINAGDYHTQVGSDHWTVTTVDGSLSAQWEHTLLVTDTGCEVLTLRSSERMRC